MPRLRTHDGDELEIIDEKPKRKSKPARKRRVRLLILAGCGLLGILGGTAAYWIFRAPGGTDACPVGGCATAEPTALHRSDWQPVLCPEILGSPGDKVALVAQLAGSDAPELFVMDAAGRNLCPLTRESLFIDSPSWSPDGRQVAIHLVQQSDDTLSRDITLLNLETGDRASLTHSDSVSTAADWSPNGEQLVFVQGSGGQKDLYTIAADSSDLRRLTHDSAAAGAPTWSPDGRWIAFASTRDQAAAPRERDRSEIYLLEVATGRIRRLTDNTIYDDLPTWSPDGSQIAFVSTTSPDSDAQTDLMVMDSNCDQLTGGCAAHTRNLTQNGAGNQYPHWLADGQHIAYLASESSGDSGLYVLDMASGDIRRLTRPAVQVYAFDWWPGD